METQAFEQARALQNVASELMDALRNLQTEFSICKERSDEIHLNQMEKLQELAALDKKKKLAPGQADKWGQEMRPIASLQNGQKQVEKQIARLQRGINALNSVNFQSLFRDLMMY